MIIEFYEGSEPNSDGVYLSEILNWNYNQLEGNHNFIQWLFPNREPSRFNLDAPLLTDEVVDEFNRRPELKRAVRRSFDMMVKFYCLDDQDPWWITKNNHNFLRLTRILNFLRELKMTEELNFLYTKLFNISKRSLMITDITNSFWFEAYVGPDTIEKYYDEF